MLQILTVSYDVTVQIVTYKYLLLLLLPLLLLKIMRLPSSTTRYRWLVVWLSGNALVVINEVTLRQARLIQGWVTVCGQVNHLGM